MHRHHLTREVDQDPEVVKGPLVTHDAGARWDGRLEKNDGFGKVLGRVFGVFVDDAYDIP